MDIRPPLITGNTLEEQVMQIIRYLIRLVKQLRELPENAPEQTVATKLVQQSSSIQKLTVGKDLRVGNDLAVIHDVLVGNDIQALGSVNGVYVRSVQVIGNSFPMQCYFDKWEETGEQQIFLITGAIETTPVLGVLRVNDEKRVYWSGTAGVSCTAQEAGGSVLVKLSSATNAWFTVQSAHKFTV